MTELEMIQKVNEWIELCPKDQQVIFDTCSFDDLSLYHRTLGQSIRNELKLWEVPWIPELDKNKIDISKYHPDAISMRIIKAVWKKRQHEAQTI